MKRRIDTRPMPSRWISGALIGCLMAAVWQRVAAVHRRRLHDQPHALPERVQVWEDEGGQNQMPGQPR